MNIHAGEAPHDGPWLRARPVGEAVWRLEELYVSPAHRAHLWLVEGEERCLLVDGGYGLLPWRPLVARIAAGRGLVAVATHAHCDHLGALHEFGTVLAHPLELPILRAPDGRNTQALPYLAENPVFVDAAGFVPPADAFVWHPVASALPLDEGDRLDLGGRSLTVLHTPGHAPGSLSLFEPAAGLLFPADTLLDGPIHDAIAGASVPDLLASHVRLRALEPRRVHPGHFRSFDGERLAVLVDRYARARG